MPPETAIAQQDVSSDLTWGIFDLSVQYALQEQGILILVAKNKLYFVITPGHQRGQAQMLSCDVTELNHVSCCHHSGGRVSCQDFEHNCVLAALPVWELVVIHGPGGSLPSLSEFSAKKHQQILARDSPIQTSLKVQKLVLLG